MKCPHCLVNIHVTFRRVENVVIDSDWRWDLHSAICPACQKAIINLEKLKKQNNSTAGWIAAYPTATGRPPLPCEVSEEFAKDYREACLVISESPKASAALSRRCLQNLLRSKGGVTPQDLSHEIDQILPKLPTYLAGAVDAIRNIGNFAAHPIKSTNTGEIVEVEPGEAEWLLELLEQLLDFYFVYPAKLQAKRDALNKKLQEAGKPPMK